MADGSPSNYSSDLLGRTLTKADFVEAVYSQIDGLSRRESADIIDLLFEGIKETLAQGKSVKISGFGNFLVREKGSRPGRNPKTGGTIKISARRVLTFKPSQVLKNHLNE